MNLDRSRIEASLRSLLGDIRFWILLFLLLRLYGINFPPLETGHNWRQSIVNMVARNFFEQGANILYPRVDMAGAGPGIAGMEFPLLNYLIHLIATCFGWQDWYGRAIVLLSSSIGSWYFYRIIKKLFSRRTAFYATLVLLSSIWFTYSRKVMPDVFACSLVIVAFYHGLRSLEKRNGYGDLIAYGTIGTLGVLSKIPAGYPLLFMIPFFFEGSHPLSKRMSLLGTSILMSIPVLFWYFHWVPHLNQTYGNWQFPMSRELSRGSSELIEHAPRILKRFYSSAVKYIAFFCSLGGIGIVIHRRERPLLLALAIGVPAFLLFMVKAGVQFAKHDYYVIPFVPLMSLLAGRALKWLPYRRMALILLAGILIEGVANQWHSIPIDEEHWELKGLEADLDRVSDRDDLILINSGKQPTPMYFAHRKGWLEKNETIRDPEALRKRMQKGLEYVVVLKNVFAERTEVPLGKKVLDRPAYSIHDLREAEEK